MRTEVVRNITVLRTLHKCRTTVRTSSHINITLYYHINNTFYWLVLRALLNVQKLLLTRSDAKVIVMFWTHCETAYVQCCRQWVEVSGSNIGSGLIWWCKAEEGVVKRKGITRVEKCRSCKIVTKNIEVAVKWKPVCDWAEVWRQKCRSEWLCCAVW